VESLIVGLAAGLVVSWATRATGANAAIARANTQLIDFKTRLFMRFSSAIQADDQWIGKFASTISGSD
jgi:hypothetical protein